MPLPPALLLLAVGSLVVGATPSRPPPPHARSTLASSAPPSTSSPPAAAGSPQLSRHHSSSPCSSWTPTPAADRLVAIAYSPWFPPVRFGSQGGCTWGEPAIGAYASSNRTVIRQHAEWLRDAGLPLTHTRTDQ